MRGKQPYSVQLNLENCKYTALRVVARDLGWQEASSGQDWDVLWTDSSINVDRVAKLHSYQRVNHFPGMMEVCRKSSLARNMARMQQRFPAAYNFAPATYLLPMGLPDLMADLQKAGPGAMKGSKTFILKPSNGAQGRGIRLVQTAEAAAKAVKHSFSASMVASTYIANPLLVNGLKFDLRIYVLVAGCDPLNIFIFEEGLVRFCTEQYQAPSSGNLDTCCMHLTNYAINKRSEHYEFNTGGEAQGNVGNKWSLAALREWFAEQGYPWMPVWQAIQQLVVKSIIAVTPLLQHNYRSVVAPEDSQGRCFEVLGYDILLDDKLKPWLVEINHSPSFNIDSPLDLAIKRRMLASALKLVVGDVPQLTALKGAAKKATESRLYAQTAAPKAGPLADGTHVANGLQGGQSIMCGHATQTRSSVRPDSSASGSSSSADCQDDGSSYGSDASTGQATVLAERENTDLLLGSNEQHRKQHAHTAVRPAAVAQQWSEQENRAVQQGNNTKCSTTTGAANAGDNSIKPQQHSLAGKVGEGPSMGPSQVPPSCLPQQPCVDGYLQIYPAVHDRALQQEYEVLLQGSMEVFNTSFLAKVRAMILEMQEKKRREEAAAAEEARKKQFKAERARLAARKRAERMRRQRLEQEACQQALLRSNAAAGQVMLEELAGDRETYLEAARKVTEDNGVADDGEDAALPAPKARLKSAASGRHSVRLPSVPQRKRPPRPSVLLRPAVVDMWGAVPGGAPGGPAAGLGPLRLLPQLSDSDMADAVLAASAATPAMHSRFTPRRLSSSTAAHMATIPDLPFAAAYLEPNNRPSCSPSLSQQQAGTMGAHGPHAAPAVRQCSSSLQDLLPSSQRLLQDGQRALKGPHGPVGPLHGTSNACFDTLNSAIVAHSSLGQASRQQHRLPRRHSTPAAVLEADTAGGSKGPGNKAACSRCPAPRSVSDAVALQCLLQRRTSSSGCVGRSHQDMAAAGPSPLGGKQHGPLSPRCSSTDHDGPTLAAAADTDKLEQHDEAGTALPAALPAAPAAEEVAAGVAGAPLDEDGDVEAEAAAAAACALLAIPPNAWSTEVLFTNLGVGPTSQRRVGSTAFKKLMHHEKEQLQHRFRLLAQQQGQQCSQHMCTTTGGAGISRSEVTTDAPSATGNHEAALYRACAAGSTATHTQLTCGTHAVNHCGSHSNMQSPSPAVLSEQELDRTTAQAGKGKQAAKAVRNRDAALLYSSSIAGRPGTGSAATPAAARGVQGELLPPLPGFEGTLSMLRHLLQKKYKATA